MPAKTAMDTDMVTVNQEILSALCSCGRRSIISQNSSSEKHRKLSQIKSGRKHSSREANSRMLNKRGHCRDSKPLGRRIYQQSFSHRKKMGKTDQ